MKTNVYFSVDPVDLIAKISWDTGNERIVNELKIICSNLSESSIYNQDQITIPWYELRRGLDGVARILKRENAATHFDEFSLSLIKDIVTDKKSIKDKASAVTMTEDELLKVLKEIGFNRSLKIEQKRDVTRLLSLKHGANFSVPGAGKTCTLLAVYSILKYLGVITKLIVISPINAFISWEEEIEEIFPTNTPTILRLQSLHLKDYSELERSNPDIILVNYEKFRRDIGQLIPFFIRNKIHLILDESHRVKSGMNNQSYSQIVKLADLAKRRDILSGTPMPQSYMDLDPQFDFLWPGEKVIPVQIANNVDEETRINAVNIAISGLYVRTTKIELGLEDPVIKYLHVKMGPIQAELYRLFKSETARVIAGLDKPTISNFRRIGRCVVKLLQAATNPMLLTLKDEYEGEVIPPPVDREFWELLDDFIKYEKPVKIEYLRGSVENIISSNPDNKVLIWSYFVRNIQILEKIFKDYNPVLIYGGIPTGSDEDEAFREGRIKKFHEDKSCRIMIANPQACGEGISLHKVCHHAIYLDRNFNAAYFLQSIDRIHRLGLAPGIKTNVDILVSENSIDELLINRLNDKINAMGSVLNDPYLKSLAYDPADIPTEDEFSIDAKDIELIKKHVGIE